MKMSPSMISLGFRGQRTFSTDQHVQLAKILSVSLEEILINLNIEVPQRAIGGRVAVTGEIRAGCKVVSGTPAGPKHIGIWEDGLEALRYTDPGPLDGAYICFLPTESVSAEAVGRPCICTTDDGDQLFATPSLGAMRGTYTLRDWAGRVLEVDARLTSAAPVACIKFGA